MHRVDTLYDTLAVETRYFEYLSSAVAYANDHYNEPDVMEIQIDGKKYEVDEKSAWQTRVSLI